MKTILLKLTRQKYQYNFKENTVLVNQYKINVQGDLIYWVIDNFLEQYDHNMWFKYNAKRFKIK